MTIINSARQLKKRQSHCDDTKTKVFWRGTHFWIYRFSSCSGVFPVSQTVWDFCVALKRLVLGVEHPECHWGRKVSLHPKCFGRQRFSPVVFYAFFFRVIFLNVRHGRLSSVSGIFLRRFLHFVNAGSPTVLTCIVLIVVKQKHE